MWIGTSNGLYAYDPAIKTLTRFVHDDANNNSLCSNIVRAITEDKKGRIWIGTSKGLSMKNHDRNGFTNFQYHENAIHSISKGDVNSLSTDDDGRLWIGTSSGLDILNTKTGEIINIAYDKRNVQGLAGRNVNTIYNDHQGIYWVGTMQGGISKYDKNLNLFNLVQSMPFDAEGLPSPLVTSFSANTDDKIFIGTEHGGVSLFDPGKKTFKRFNIRSRTNPSDDGIVVLTLKYTQKNELLVGTFGDGLFIINPVTGNYEQLPVGNAPGSAEIFTIAEDHNQNIWLGCNGPGIIVLNPQHEIIARYNPNPTLAGEFKLPINGYIRDIIEDRVGNIWIATHGGGIAMMNVVNKKFSIYNNLNSNLPGDKVMTLLEDIHGNIWAGTFGGGLALFNKQKQQFTGYSEKDGLANNNVYKILEDGDGKLWVSTNLGISCLDLGTKKFSNYNLHNGLQPSNFSRGS
jgi:ligand-binding sensor domain-containing protein